MKKIVAMLLTLVMLIGAASVLSGCGTPDDEGAEISVYLGEEIYDFDPTEYYADSNAEALMSLLYEPLFSVNAKGKLECSAAKKYSIDKKKNEIVIELKESYWSDGKRVVADDYIYAWTKLILEPNNANPAAALFFDIENALAIKNGEASIYDFGARQTDVYEITINYRDGADTDRLLKNLASIATAPLREDIVTSAPTYWSKNTGTAVFNGPFKISLLDYEEGRLTVSRNEGYHQKMTSEKYTKFVTPHLLNATFNVDGADVALGYSDIESKAVFYMTDASLADRKANADKATVSDDLSVYSYVFDTKNPLFAIKEVRKALSAAIDRNAIIEAITFGKAADGFIPDMIDTFGGEALISSDDTKNVANALLKGVDLSGVSKEFTLTVNDDPESIAVAELVKASWEALDAGFTVNVEKLGKIDSTVNGNSFSDSALQVLLSEIAVGAADYDVIALDWQLYSTDPFVALSAFSTAFSGMGKNFATGESRTNISGWSDMQYDALINAAYKATDAKTRNEALRAAEKLLVESAPIAPIVFNQNFSFSSADISGVTTDAFGNFVLDKMSLANYKEYLED